MNPWKLETAKARLSEVVRRARQEGPQTITVRGDAAAVVLSAADYRQLRGGTQTGPWIDRLRAVFTGEVDLERDADPGRDLAL